MLRVFAGLLLAQTGAGLSVQAAALEQTELGVRINALHANGNIYGAGLHLRRLLDDGFFVTATLDRQVYDAARPPAPLEQSEQTLPSVTNTVAGVNVGRLQGLGDSRIMWFWSMGLAVGFPQPSRPGPGQIQLEAETEVHLRSAAGIEALVSEHWSLMAAVRVERHYVNLRYSDPATAQRATLSSLTPAGVYLSLGYRF